MKFLPSRRARPRTKAKYDDEDDASILLKKRLTRSARVVCRNFLIAAKTTPRPSFVPFARGNETQWLK